ncbi:MAG: hypothetical protein HXX81_04725 [Campylobacterales bacterium]|nr:hypothetical protein [Campylobacterales bacterium]
MRKSVVILFCLVSVAFSTDPKELCKKFNLSPSSKAIKQWERVFEKEDKMEKMGIVGLSDAEKSALKDYLIKHAADSDQPAAAGI